MLFRFWFWFVFSLIFPPSLYAAAWTVPASKWEYYYDVTYYSTDHYYDTQGKRHLQDRYTKLEDSHRFEYGLQDDLTLGANLRLSAVHSTALQSSRTIFRDPLLSPGRNGRQDIYITGWNYGLADPKLYLRQRLWQNDTSVASAQGTLKFPSLFNRSVLARSGSDEFSGEARLLAGHNFEWLEQPHFVNLEVAYEWRPQNGADLFHADATLGLKLNDSLTLLPQLFSSWRAGGEQSNFTQTPDDAYDLLKGQLSVVFPITPAISFQAGGFHHLHGRNTGGGSGATLSIWVKP